MAALSALAHNRLKEKGDSLLGQMRQSFGQKRSTHLSIVRGRLEPKRRFARPIPVESCRWAGVKKQYTRGARQAATVWRINGDWGDPCAGHRTDRQSD